METGSLNPEMTSNSVCVLHAIELELVKWFILYVIWVDKNLFWQYI